MKRIKVSLQAFAGNDLNSARRYNIPLVFVKWCEDYTFPEGGLFCFQKIGQGHMPASKSRVLTKPSKVMNAMFELASSLNLGSSPEKLFQPTSHHCHLLSSLDVHPSLLSSSLEGWEEFWQKLTRDLSALRPSSASSLTFKSVAPESSPKWSTLVAYQDAPALPTDPVHPSFPSLSKTSVT